MTKSNREKQYKHFRDLENNYAALPGRNHDLEKTDVLRGRAKISADEMLVRHPELSVFDKQEEPEVKHISKVKSNSKEVK